MKEGSEGCVVSFFFICLGGRRSQIPKCRHVESFAS